MENVLGIRNVRDVLDKAYGIFWCLPRSLFTSEQPYDFHEDLLPSRNVFRTGTATEEPGETLNMVSWNIYGGRRTTELIDALRRVRDAEDGLDVISLMEAPPFDDDLYAHELFANMEGTFAPMAMRATNRTRLIAHSVGNALFTTFPMTTEVVDLPKVTWNYHGKGLVMVRNAIVGNHPKLNIGLTHLDIYTLPHLRDVQFAPLVDYLDFSKPIALLMDGNFFHQRASEPVPVTLRVADFQFTQTWKGNFSDHHAVRGTRSVRAYLKPSNASDHPMAVSVWTPDYVE